MKYLSLSTALALLVLPLAGCDAPSSSTSASAQKEASLPKVEQVPSLFVEALDPYGEWLPNDRYGFVWKPKVASDWRPYIVGRWAFTDYGLTWLTAEPFGWVTFHYGRWAHLDKEGWVWVPGEQWAPAWVAWRQNEDTIGWAPLPPETSLVARLIEKDVDERFSIPASSYIAVPAEKFAEQQIEPHVLKEFQFTKEAFPNVTLLMVSRSVVTANGPSITFIRQKTKTPFEVFKVERIAYRPDRAPTPMVENGKIYFTAPPVEETAKQKPPVRSEVPPATGQDGATQG